MINELPSSTSAPMLSGNKYLFMHTYIASNLVGCIMAWFSLFANVVLLAMVLILRKFYFFVILVALFKFIPTISLSLSDSCDVFDVFDVHLIYNKINMSLWPCYQANILWLYYMNSSWISCSFFSIYFVCTCSFEDKYLRDDIHLETYTHER